MGRAFRNSLGVVFLLIGCVAQAGAVFLLYGLRVNFMSILVLTLGLGFTFYFTLLTRWMKPPAAAGLALLLALAAECPGVVVAFNTYGT